MGKTEGSRRWAPQWLGTQERGYVRVGVGADPVCGAAGVLKSRYIGGATAPETVGFRVSGGHGQVTTVDIFNFNRLIAYHTSLFSSILSRMKPRNSAEESIPNSNPWPFYRPDSYSRQP